MNKFMKDNLKSLLFAVVVAVLFRSLAFEPFSIPSGSMKPNLLVGDYIFVSKYYYGYSKYSFPFGLAPIEGRVMELHKPKAGDVIVFKLPKDPSINYIKRLVGMPGDKIEIKSGTVYVNDRPLKRIYIDDYLDSNGKKIPKFYETNLAGISYNILKEENGGYDNSEVFIVPDKHYFFMGDNRDNSIDSRFLTRVGFVPEENIVGKAEVVFFSSGSKIWEIWSWLFKLDFDRFFKKIENVRLVSE